MEKRKGVKMRNSIKRNLFIFFLFFPLLTSAQIGNTSQILSRNKDGIYTVIRPFELNYQTVEYQTMDGVTTLKHRYNTSISFNQTDKYGITVIRVHIANDKPQYHQMKNIRFGEDEDMTFFLGLSPDNEKVFFMWNQNFFMITNLRKGMIIFSH